MNAEADQMTAAVRRDFPHWHPWPHVARNGLWYARRPRTSPAVVVGPVPLAALYETVAERDAQLRA